MTDVAITIALILAFIAIVWMTWKELRKDLIREDHQNCPGRAANIHARFSSAYGRGWTYE